MMNFLTVFQSIKIQAKISMRVLMTSTQSERLNPKAASSRTAMPVAPPAAILIGA